MSDTLIPGLYEIGTRPERLEVIRNARHDRTEAWLDGRLLFTLDSRTVFTSQIIVDWGDLDGLALTADPTPSVCLPPGGAR